MKNYYDLLTSIHAALLLFPAQVTCMYKQSSTFLLFFLHTSGTKLVDYISNIWITMHTGLTLGQTTWDNFGLVSNSCCHLAVFGIDYILVIREKSCILKWDDLPWWLKWWICCPRSACCHPHPPPHCPPLLLSPCPGTVVSWEQDPSPWSPLLASFLSCSCLCFSASSVAKHSCSSTTHFSSSTCLTRVSSNSYCTWRHHSMLVIVCAQSSARAP